MESDRLFQSDERDDWGVLMSHSCKCFLNRGNYDYDGESMRSYQMLKRTAVGIA